MTRNRNVADVQSNGISAVPPSTAGKNAVINGGFDIWQRGTSFTAINSYTADRWYKGVASANTVTRQATNDTTNLPFIQYCLRSQKNAGSTSITALEIVNNFETVNSIPLAGKTVTLSFYARKGADFSATAFASNIFSGTGTDQNILGSGYTGQTTVAAGSHTLTTTWQRFSITGTIGVTATEICVYWNATMTSGTASTNDYFEITGVQLEAGSTATPFSRNGSSIQGELAACQRYYWRNTPGSLYGIVASSAVIVNTTTALVGLQFPVTMRTTPTSAEWGNLMIHDSSSGNYALSAVTVSALNSGPTTIGFEVTASGLTANRSCVLRNNNNSAAYLGFSAEL